MKKISMYTLSTCPWCRRTKKFFTEHDVPFDFIDYDLADEETQKKVMDDMNRHKAHGFPFVKINGDSVEGFNPERYANLLGI